MFPTCNTSRRFFDAYCSDATFATVDMFLVTYATEQIRLFLPFNRTILYLSAIRFENRRQNKKAAWESLVTDLIEMDKMGHTVAANNWYDWHYIHYFTGLRPLYLPSLALYVKGSYSPQPGREVLVVGRKNALKALQSTFDSILEPKLVPLKVRSAFGLFLAPPFSSLLCRYVAIYLYVCHSVLEPKLV